MDGWMDGGGGRREGGEREPGMRLGISLDGCQGSSLGSSVYSTTLQWREPRRHVPAFSPLASGKNEEDDRKVAGACSEALRRLKTTSTAGEGEPVSQRPPQDGLQSLSDGAVNIRTGLADVGGRKGENDIGKLGEGG